jgi:hypothetical protein
MDVNETELAWAAGFFDGEGYFGMQKPRQRKGGWTYSIAVMKVSQCEPTTLHRFRDAVGVGTVKGPYPPPRNGISKRDRWEFSVQGAAAFTAADRILPYLSGPKKQAVTVARESTVAIAAARPAAIADRQTPRDLALLHQLYWVQELSADDCAPQLGMSASGLRRWMQKNNYPRRNAAQGRWATARRRPESLAPDS